MCKLSKGTRMWCALRRSSQKSQFFFMPPLVFSFSVISFGGPAVQASLLPFSVDQSGQYLVVARERINGSTDGATNNFELGANKAPVPSTDNFLDGGSSGGPTLLGAVPPLPSNDAPVFQGIGLQGNIALTEPGGEFEFQDVGIYADPGIGIRVAASDDSFNKSSNAFFNDPMHFPNTFDTNTQTGTSVNPNDADQTTRVDPSGQGHPSDNVGITYGFDHTNLVSELSAAKSAINGLPSTDTLSTGGDGKIETDTTYTASSGLNVVDIDTGGNDFLINNANFVINGPADAVVIFRLPNNDNMIIDNSNVLYGNAGIGPNNIMFFTDQTDSDRHFSMSNTIVNGVVFWSLGRNGGVIDVSNAQGCTQLIADIVDMDDVRFTRCQFVPEPTSMLLLGLAALGLRRRRKV